MLRLRTTVVLSLLALGVGVAGTHWLSQRSADEPLALPAKRPSASSSHLAAAPPAHAHAPFQATVRSHRLRQPPIDSDIAGQSTGISAAPPPELVPLDMPANRDVAYDRLRGHLDGRVIMRISIDGTGRVTAASVAESSGDAVLDAHALRSVRGWRFAVPPDHPDGLSADLPMRFSSHDDPVASLR
ncbi:energy transducer TonB family protein [Rhodanobacter sp. BL-MT-08]